MPIFALRTLASHGQALEAGENCLGRPASHRMPPCNDCEDRQTAQAGRLDRAGIVIFDGGPTIWNSDFHREVANAATGELD